MGDETTGWKGGRDDVIQWDVVRDEAIRHLQALIRMNTTNPPGNEAVAAEYLAGVMAAEGLAPIVLKATPTRGSVMTRLRGNGAQPPLMLMAHLDVVPAQAGEWTHPPFAGELIDGFIWGRGAVDCKRLVAADLMVLLLCHRLGLPLKGDLVCLAHADEESDFTDGMALLVREHRALFDAPYALYEGAGGDAEIAGKRFVTLATAEKGWCTIEVITRGKGGHSSLPHADNPLYHMAPILARLQASKMPLHMTETTAGFFRGLSAAFASEAPKIAGLLSQMCDPATAEAALEQLPADEAQRIQFDAMLRNTVGPTMMAGSSSRWALPSQAIMTLNGRLLPGQTPADFERELRAILGPGVEYRIADLHVGAQSDLDAPVCKSIQSVMRRRDPAAPVIPTLQTGGTERGLLKSIGVQTYGFVPYRAEPGIPAVSQMAHGFDERISADNLLYAVRCLFDVVCDINGIESGQ
jgi:acetylornithine deacetylase/succinyl-diaminopimelate desuccinylase-like protein